MRLAVIADIHGNADALAAVLADLHGAAPDAIVNLGDIFSGPLEPLRVAELLDTVTVTATVRGNHDRWLTDRPGTPGDWEDRARAVLPGATVEWAGALPPTAVVGEAFLCHATPGDDLTYWLHEPIPDGRMVPRPLADIAALAGAVAEPLVLCGHTHLPGAVRLPDGRLIVNPGSVGCPAYQDDVPFAHAVSAESPHAAYAILDGQGAHWRVEHRLIPYDHLRAARLAMGAGSPVWAQALATGFVPVP